VREVAVALGTDVPSQLAPGLAIGTGAGDDVERVDAIAPHALVIVPQDFHLSAADVYAEADRLGTPRPAAELERAARDLRAALSRSDPLPAELLVNDLEPAAISLCPNIPAALRAVRDAGADHAMVSGSGPTVFGVFWGPRAEDRATAAADSLEFPARSAVPWRSASDIHAFRHNLRSGE
jgi:4-diphosphocytidyl-2-C-methyl-D-erythritol kinase